ncbi:TPA: hypothetical protein P0O00_004253, partial [Yersinia enterocolitica]|nr:hypothetical protein [Yersinia enterocolitica]
MMDITKSREDFEANYAKKLRSNFDRNIYRTDRYVSLNVQAHWETWQAARESIVVELPTQDEYDDPLSAYNAISDCKKI